MTNIFILHTVNTTRERKFKKPMESMPSLKNHVIKKNLMLAFIYLECSWNSF